MNRTNRYIASLFVVASLAAHGSIIAVQAAQGTTVQVRVYDRQHKDYHNWDNNENSAWGRFQVENHQKSHDYKRANKKQQAQYWNWRHAHPDSTSR